jgi:hypothetical protein
MKKCIKVLEIIAEELKMPLDSSLSEILAGLWMIDEGNEIQSLLVQAGTQDLLEMFKAEGLIR